MKTRNPITKAIEIAGLQPLAAACGVTYQAVYKWEILWDEQRRMPRTEYMGETNHAANIEKATNGEVTRDELLKLEKKTA